MAFGPAGVRELRGQAVTIAQRVTLIAHHKTVKRGRVTFALTDVITTRRKGICTNYPGPGTEIKVERDTNRDFFFLGAESETLVNDVPLIDGVARVELACQDFAGSTSVVAILVSDDDQVFSTVLDIPLSSAADGIADHWKKRFTSDPASLLAADDTSEFVVPEAGEVKGDGFTVFEKYRGFMIRGKHRRLDPRIKDAFILDSSGVYSLTYQEAPDSAFAEVQHAKVTRRHWNWNGFIPGLGIRFYLIEPDEMGSRNDKLAGRINFNEDNDQNGVRIVLNTELPRPGQAALRLSDARPIEVNPRFVSTLSKTTVTTPAGTMIDHVVWHELGHKLDLRHPVRLFSRRDTTRAALAAIFSRGTPLLDEIFRVNYSNPDHPTIESVEWKAPRVRGRGTNVLFLEAVASAAELERAGLTREADILVADELASTEAQEVFRSASALSDTDSSVLPLTLHGHAHLASVQLFGGNLPLREAVRKLRLPVLVHTGSFMDSRVNFQDLEDASGITLEQRRRMSLVD